MDTAGPCWAHSTHSTSSGSVTSSRNCCVSPGFFLFTWSGGLERRSLWGAMGMGHSVPTGQSTHVRKGESTSGLERRGY